MNIPAIPHRRGSQRGILPKFGRLYVQAPNAIAIVSAIAPKIPTKIYKYISSLFFQISNIIALITIKAAVRINVFLHKNVTLRSAKIASVQL